MRSSSTTAAKTWGSLQRSSTVHYGPLVMALDPRLIWLDWLSEMMTVSRGGQGSIICSCTEPNNAAQLSFSCRSEAWEYGAMQALPTLHSESGNEKSTRIPRDGVRVELTQVSGFTAAAPSKGFGQEDYRPVRSTPGASHAPCKFCPRPSHDRLQSFALAV